MNKKQKGFSLIELLIVVAIILIIAAIAIPNLLRAQMAAHESSAVGSVRTIVTSQVTYQSTWGVGYANGLTVLGTPAAGCATALVTQACLIDPSLTTGLKSGYNINTAAAGGTGTASSPNTTFGVDAWPIVVGSTGTRSFCSDETGVIHFDTSGAAAGTTDTACEAVASILQ
jgi:type IV pilus assembly protein PilA